MDIFLKKILNECNGEKITPTQHLIFVSIREQKLYLFDSEKLVKTYEVSTSRKPPSCVKDSLGTPTGLHKIDGKIGAGVRCDTVFKGRVGVGTISEQTPQERNNNLITSRILRLRGLQNGVNAGGDVDTYSRYVYIHGTNQEDKIGTPNSHGCVLLRGAEVAELFDIAQNGDIVLISKD